MSESPGVQVASAAQSLLSASQSEIDEALQRYLPRADVSPRSIHEAMRYSVLAPGKRFRPALLLICADALGVARAEALPSACALELVHAFSLIHDDLPAMDDDDLRRGLPTSHKKFGEAMAILAGDALSALAFQLIAEETRHKDLVSDLVCVLSRALGTGGMIGGQVLDMEAEGMAPDLEHVHQIHLHKTAALISAACEMAAILARAQDPVRLALKRYGESLGLAFQVTDDLLDETSSDAQMGKKTHKDQARGKLTWVRCVGVEETRDTARRLVDEALAAINGVLPRTLDLELLGRFLLSRLS